MQTSEFDPYAGNLLVQGLGPILSPMERLAQLTTRPPVPPAIDGIPRHVRVHMLQTLRDLYIPSPESARIAETIDLMVRQGYRYRDPRRATTWTIVGNDPAAARLPRAPGLTSLVAGHSGCGKSNAILRWFGCYPQQIITHETFPRLVGNHAQVVWLSVDVPASGRLVHLARNLMMTWDDALARSVEGYMPRFTNALVRERSDGAKLFDEWLRVACSHFLGILHLDEIQNFFKLPTLAQRKTGRTRKSEVNDVELSLVEDQMLRAVLTLVNTWEIPVIVSGTPDGATALLKRLSNAQRFAASGFHRLEEFRSVDDRKFQLFLTSLGQYQFLNKRLAIDDTVRSVVLELTAGVPRLIVALWLAAQRLALERTDDTFRIEDLRRASKTLLGSVAPAVAALRSGDPTKMRQYEDLLPRDDAFWNSFWAGGTTT